jgi:DNA adenine methylase
MILRRSGNKTKIAHKIIPYFPKHEIYVELFFGAGGMFFNKPQVFYNFLNDIDNEVYNCFDVLTRKKDELKNYIEMMPVHESFFKECKNREPANEIEKCVYFLFLSNFTFISKGNTMQIGCYNSKEILLQNIEKTYIRLARNANTFLNCDFRNVINRISFKNKDCDLKGKTFIYSDPPYLETKNNYSMKNTWNEKDVNDCMDVTFNSGIKGAMSEFDNEFIIKQAKERGLNINIIGERANLNNRRTEILITNYELENKLF